jgi:DNA processing protein
VVCVKSVAEVPEFAGELGRDAVCAGAPPGRGTPAVQDGLDGLETRAWDALPLRAGRPVESVARAAGLAVPETLAALGRLELTGLAERTPSGWRRRDARQAAGA